MTRNSLTNKRYDDFKIWTGQTITADTTGQQIGDRLDPTAQQAHSRTAKQAFTVIHHIDIVPSTENDEGITWPDSFLHLETKYLAII